MTSRFRTALASGERNYVAGCAFRSLSCAAQVLFALNRRYLINERARLHRRRGLRLTIDNLSERTARVWREIGGRALEAALAELGSIERELACLTEATR